MAVSWSISHPSRLVLVLAKGEFHSADLMRLLIAIDAARASSYRKLIDISQLADSMSPTVLREFARIVRHRERERTVGPIAIVASTASVSRLANRFADDARGERLIEVFADQPAARRWLNSFYAYESDARLETRT
jgi:hypothetical protein